MKTALHALFALSLSVLMAQAPQKFNYQAVARDGLGEPLANQNLTVTFSILDGSPSGTVVFSEQQAKTTNTFGVFNAEIGANANLSTVNWASGPKYLRVDVASTAFTGTLGTAQLLSVPYALFSNNANTAQNSTLNIPGQTTGSLLYFDGNTWAPLPNGSTSDQVLTWSNNSPSWQNLPQGTVYQAGSGLALNGNTFLLNLNPTQFQINTITGGLEFNPAFLTAINQAPVEINRLTQTSSVPNGFVLKWNSTTLTWEPQPENSVNYIAGSGVQIQALTNEISLRTSPQFSYDLSGVLQINEDQLEINPGQISQSGATNGQVMKWNGATWAPADDAGGLSYTAGDGIELNPPNEIRLRADPNQFTFNSGVLGLNTTNKIIHPNQIQGGTAQDGQVLTWDNTTQNWVAQDVPDAVINTGNGLEIDNSDVLNVLVDGLTINLDANNSLQVGQIGTGNLGNGAVTSDKLAVNAVTLDKIDFSSSSPSQVLKVNTAGDGLEWANDAGGVSYTAKGGVEIDGSNRIGARIDDISLDTLGAGGT
ncbi:MAG: hypothetical protein SNJ77_03745, partial [Cytophagales bacterium]